MNSLSAGEIESSSREAFLLKTDEVLNLISPDHSQADLHRGKPGHAEKTNFYLCGRSGGIMFCG
jgi:hypothetical protein